MRTILTILYFGLILLLCFAGTSDPVVYSHEGFSKWLPYILIFVAQPLVLYLLLTQISFKNFKIQKSLIVRGIIAISVLTIIMSYLYFLQTKKENDLVLNGCKTRGIVYKKWQDNYKQDSKWLLVCNFSVDGKPFYTFSETDKENKYKVGDTLTIIYSTRFLGNCIIEELENN